MKYYAMLNTVTRIVVRVFQTETVITSNDYIQLQSLDTSLVGKKYDANTQTFVTPTVQDIKRLTTDEIAYKTANKWLSTKLDEMETAIASGGGGGGSSIFTTGEGVDSYALRITDTTLSDTITGDYSFSLGLGNTAKAYNTVIGKFSKEDIASGYISNTIGDAFVIGNGTKSVSSGVITKNNAFRVTQTGSVFGMSSFNSSGADYAECFEWEDGNPNKENRAGKFVTLNGNKVKIASADDDILGVVTANSSVIGNNPIDWEGRFVKDVYGCIQCDKEGIPITSSTYDETQTYIERTKRPEWATIGLVGQLVVEDDGTCIPNEYCHVLDGIATAVTEEEKASWEKALGKVKANYVKSVFYKAIGYRVLKRLDENHVLILFK